MTDDTDRWVPEARLTGDLPVTDAASAAEHVPDDATMLVSGFGSVGYPKAAPLALADSARDGDRDLALTVVSGGSVGSEIDTALVEAGAVARRYPYVGTPEARAAANEDRMAMHDRHVSAVADEARFGHYGQPDVAVVEAVACGPDWLVPSGSLGQTPAFVESAWLLLGFVLAQFGACAAGSVGILLTMTDNQRGLLVVNTVVTLVLAVVAIPLTAAFGLPGLVFGYLLMLTLNNGLEILVLYRAAGLQPFTRAHLRPLVAAVPFVGVALAVQVLVAAPILAAVAGTALGLATYGAVLQRLGFEPAERRLVGTLAGRYRRALPGVPSSQS